MTAAHAHELGVVGRRLQEVLASKDATIAQLRGELSATLAQLHQATDDLMLP
jgi:hypothetical protein